MSEPDVEVSANRTPAGLLVVGVPLILIGGLVWFLRWQASSAPYAFGLVDSRWTAGVILGVVMVAIGALLTLVGIAALAVRR